MTRFANCRAHETHPHTAGLYELEEATKRNTLLNSFSPLPASSLSGMPENLDSSHLFPELSAFLEDSVCNPMQQRSTHFPSSSETFSEVELWLQFLTEPESELEIPPSVTSSAVPEQTVGKNQTPGIQTPVSNDTALEKEGVGVKRSRKKKTIEKNEPKLPVFIFKTKSDSDYLDDGYKWRKYGKKSVRSGASPRSYYKCTEESCCVKKKVERDPRDPSLLMTTYEGKHNHQAPLLTYYAEYQPASVFPSNNSMNVDPNSASEATIIILRREYP